MTRSFQVWKLWKKKQPKLAKKLKKLMKSWKVILFVQKCQEFHFFFLISNFYLLILFFIFQRLKWQVNSTCHCHRHVQASTLLLTICIKCIICTNILCNSSWIFSLVFSSIILVRLIFLTNTVNSLLIIYLYTEIFLVLSILENTRYLGELLQ